MAAALFVAVMIASVVAKSILAKRQERQNAREQRMGMEESRRLAARLDALCSYNFELYDHLCKHDCSPRRG